MNQLKLDLKSQPDVEAEGVPVELFRTHAPSGEPAPETLYGNIPYKFGQTPPDAVMNYIRPFNPVRTTQNCVYLFDSPEYGKGRMVIEIDGRLYRERMDEKVQMLEIERVLGMREPGKVSDTMAWMYAFRLQIHNPYSQIVGGAFFAIFGLMIIANIVFVQDMDAGSSALLVLLALLLVGLGALGLGRLGAIRLKWWHRARAVVKRRGDKMPSDLHLLP